MQSRNRTGKPAYVFRNVPVNDRNMHTIRGVIPSDQKEVLQTGDTVSVIYFSNPSHGIRGTITIWNGSLKGAISIGNGSIWGEWDEERRLLVTDMHEETWSAYGVAISGNISYNMDGMRGILSSGIFYIDSSHLTPAA